MWSAMYLATTKHIDPLGCVQALCVVLRPLCHRNVQTFEQVIGVTCWYIIQVRTYKISMFSSRC